MKSEAVCEAYCIVEDEMENSDAEIQFWDSCVTSLVLLEDEGEEIDEVRVCSMADKFLRERRARFGKR